MMKKTILSLALATSFVHFQAFAQSDYFLELCESATREQLQEAVSQGADVNAAGDNGITPLMYAASSNPNVEAIEFLIERGAGINQRNDYAGCAISYTPVNPNAKEVIAFLLKAGADINNTDVYGWTPLTLAVRETSDPLLINFLIENGADISVRDLEADFMPGGATILMHAAGNNTNPKVIESILAAMKQKDLSINATDNAGNTALHMAASNQQAAAAMIKVLLDNGADVNAVNELGNTPLFTVLANARFIPMDMVYESAVILVRAGADVNKNGEDGATPLMYAASYADNIATVNMLLGAGADVNARSPGDITALMIASLYHSQLPMLKILLDAGADINAKTSEGLTPLVFAIMSFPEYETLTFFLNNGAKADERGNYSETPLMYAARYTKDSRVIELLLEHGADVNAKDRDGSTALMYAAETQETDGEAKSNVILTLLLAGADANIRETDAALKTALEYAEEHPELINTPGFTALQTATTNRSASVATVRKASSQGTGLSFFDELQWLVTQENIQAVCSANLPDGNEISVILWKHNGEHAHDYMLKKTARVQNGKIAIDLVKELEKMPSPAEYFFTVSYNGTRSADSYPLGLPLGIPLERRLVQ